MKITEKNKDKPNWRIPGKSISMASMSFENRLSMRPSGVVSNIAIGQRKTFDNNVRCICLADKMKPKDNVIASANEKVAISK